MEPCYVDRDNLGDKEMEQHLEYKPSEKGSPSTHMEHSGLERRRTRQKLKRHYQKWWWLHLILFIAAVLLITLLL